MEAVEYYTVRTEFRITSHKAALITLFQGFQCFIQMFFPMPDKSIENKVYPGFMFIFHEPFLHTQGNLSKSVAGIHIFQHPAKSYTDGNITNGGQTRIAVFDR